MISEKYKTLTKNTVLLAISQFGTKFLSFFLVPLYTAVLSTSEYGDSDVIHSTATILIYIFTVNIGEAVLRFAMDKNANQYGVFVFGRKIVLLGTSVVVGVSLVFFYYFNVVHWPIHYFAFLSSLFLTSALSNMSTNYLRAIDKVKQVAIAGIIGAIVGIGSNIFLLLVLKTGLYGYLLSSVLSNVSVILYSVIYISPTSSRKKQCDKSVKLAMLKYSAPLMINSLAWWINSSLDKYFILANGGSSANGIYGVASKIPLILSTILTVFIQAWNLSAIKEFDRSDSDGFFTKTYETFNSILLISCSILIQFNVLLARILFSNDFFVAWKCSSILLISGLFNGLGNFIGTIFTATKDTKTLTLTSLLSAFVNIVLNAILIPKFGIIGAAISTACCFFAFWMIRIVLIKKHIDWQPRVIKALLCYVIIVIQVILEHVGGVFYWFQGICVLSLVLLNSGNILMVIKTLYSRLFKGSDSL